MTSWCKHGENGCGARKACLCREELTASEVCPVVACPPGDLAESLSSLPNVTVERGAAFLDGPVSFTVGGIVTAAQADLVSGSLLRQQHCI